MNCLILIAFLSLDGVYFKTVDKVPVIGGVNAAGDYIANTNGSSYPIYEVIKKAPKYREVKCDSIKYFKGSEDEPSILLPIVK
jgi:hypothetical protein